MTATPDGSPGAAAPRYRAFVSYSHRDAAQARRLHRALESFRVPASLRRQPGPALPRRLHPVFLDREELASSSALSGSLQQALDDSAALVVVCSPDAAASRWVNEEIRWFRSRHPERPVLAYVVGGDPGRDARTDAGAALPSALALLDVADPAGALGEPLAADARDAGDGFRAAVLKICAGLLDVRFDDLRRRDFHRRQRTLMAAGAASVALAAVFAFLAWQATLARDEARAARARAELELQSEQQTRRFLLSVFDLADANEARGTEVTVREVLDRAVVRIGDSRFARPAIRSRFLATMGKAYGSLGLNHRSVELVQESLRALPDDDRSAEADGQRIDSQLDLADVGYDMGDYAAANRALDAANALLAGPAATPARQARAALLQGDVRSRTDRVQDARADYERAIALARGAGIGREEAALFEGHGLLGLAYLDFEAGEHAAAEGRFDAAIALLEPVVGPSHPMVITATLSRGANAYASGDLAGAREDWERSLDIARKVYDADSPQIGTIKNNLGRLRLETGDLAGAEALLRDAVASDRAHRDAGFDDLAYSLHNLGYAVWAAGRADEASALFEEALAIAERSGHRMLGGLRSALADVRCSAGDASAGVALAEAALAVEREQLGADHWRTQLAVLALAYCRVAAGDPPDRDAARAALAAIESRWHARGAFVVRARAQWAAIAR